MHLRTLVAALLVLASAACDRPPGPGAVVSAADARERQRTALPSGATTFAQVEPAAVFPYADLQRWLAAAAPLLELPIEMDCLETLLPRVGTLTVWMPGPEATAPAVLASGVSAAELAPCLAAVMGLGQDPGAATPGPDGRFRFGEGQDAWLAFDEPTTGAAVAGPPDALEAWEAAATPFEPSPTLTRLSGLAEHGDLELWFPRPFELGDVGLEGVAVTLRRGARDRYELLVLTPTPAVAAFVAELPSRMGDVLRETETRMRGDLETTTSEQQPMTRLVLRTVAALRDAVAAAETSTDGPVARITLVLDPGAATPADVAVFAALLLMPRAAGAAVSVEDPGLPDTPTLRTLRADARALDPLVEAQWVRMFLAASFLLPPVEPRTVYVRGRDAAYTAEEYAALDEAAREGVEPRELDEAYYYTTRYGTPLAYARALEVADRFGFSDPTGRRILDFGYGGIGHLRLLATLGADVVGVEVDPVLRALYSFPGDTGPIPDAEHALGRIALVHGGWPADAAVREAVGGAFDLIVSKNVLKRGYVHPERPIEEGRGVDLGVDDAAFAVALFEALRPGGLVVIYNLSPAQAPEDQPFIPWADGRCPFDREALEAAGFEIPAYDEDDTETIRAFARALGWDRDPEDPMDVENDLFGRFTVLRRPPAPNP
ncbi:MAG: hypothetical protein JXB32_20990 [Deltaproteobacteria bacterium]|nr:hypothetical protein [Deltaproteobacteria bacterium]